MKNLSIIRLHCRKSNQIERSTRVRHPQMDRHGTVHQFGYVFSQKTSSLQQSIPGIACQKEDPMPC